MKIISFVILIMLSQPLMAGDDQKIYLGANVTLNGMILVWPIISLPDEKVLATDSVHCSQGKTSCAVPINKTLAAFGMSNKRKEWFDIAGVSHVARDGYHNANVSGNAIGDKLDGFIIGTQQSEKQRYIGALTSVPGLVSRKAIRKIVEPDIPGIKRILANWLKKYSKECDDHCIKGMNELVRMNNIKLQVTEYKLPSGKIFQHFTGRSTKEAKAEGMAGTTIPYFFIADFWKYSDTNGYVDESRLEMSGCDSQCSWGWDAYVSPDVIEYENTLYILGARSGGTIGGYYLFKLKDNQFELLSSLAGGD